VLPGTVVPVALDDAARAAVDAARATESGKLLRLAAQVGKKYGYYGAWQIAVVTTGLDGATSSKTVDSWGDPGPIYTEPTYAKATEATFTELDTGSAITAGSARRRAGAFYRPNGAYCPRASLSGVPCAHSSRS
jgi:hypothetical protein